MNKPPAPAEQKPKGHEERTGHPSTNHQLDHELTAAQVGRGGGDERNQELEEQSEEQVPQPGG